MMQKFFIVLALCFGMLFSRSVFADAYIGVLGGGTAGFDLQNSSIDTSSGYYIGGKVGFTCLKFLRLEEELSYQRSDIHSLERNGFHFSHVRGHITFWSLMTNVLIDLDCPFIVTPYFGGGAGYTRETGEGKGTFPFGKHQDAKESIHHDAFAWQALVGLKYYVCFGLEASIEYRYFKIKDVEANHKLGLAFTKFF